MRIEIQVSARRAAAELRAVGVAVEEVSKKGSLLGRSLSRIGGTTGRIFGTGFSVAKRATEGLSSALAKVSTFLATKFTGALRTGLHSLERWGKDLQWTGRQLEFRFTLPLVLGAYAASRWALANEQAFTKLRKVYGPAGGDVARFTKELELLRRGFVALSNIFGVAQDEVIQIGALWAAAGAQGIALAKVTRLTIETMILGDMAYQDAANSLMVLRAQFGLTTDKLAGAMAVLNVIENETEVQFNQLVDAIVRGGGSARTAGVDFRHFAAMVASLVPAGGSAAQAGNALKTVLSRIMAPTQEAADLMREFGINVNYNGWAMLTGTQRIEQFAQAFMELTPAQRAIVSAAVAMRYQISKFDILMRDVASRTGNYAKALRVSANETRNLAQYANELGIYLSSTPQAFKILQTQLKNTIAQIIVPLLPAFQALISMLNRVVRAFSELSPQTQATVLGLLALLAILGPVIAYIGTFAIVLARLGKTLNVGLGLVLRSVAAGFWLLSKAILVSHNALNLLGVSIMRVNGALKFLATGIVGTGTRIAATWTAIATAGMELFAALAARSTAFFATTLGTWVGVIALDTWAWARRKAIWLAGEAYLMAGIALESFGKTTLGTWLYVTAVDTWGWAKRTAIALAGWARQHAIVAFAWALNLAEDIKGWAVRNAISIAGWAKERAIAVAGVARTLAAGVSGYVGFVAVKARFWATSIALEVAGWARTVAVGVYGRTRIIAMYAVGYTRVFAWLAGWWAKKIALESAGWIRTVAVAAAGRARIIGMYTVGYTRVFAWLAGWWAKKIALEVAGWVRTAAVAAAGRAATIAMYTVGYARVFAWIAGWWVKRIALEAAGWLKTRTLSAIEGSALWVQYTVGTVRALVWTAGWWTKKIALDIAGWAKARAVALAGVGAWLWAGVTSLAGYLAATVRYWAQKIALEVAGWVRVRVVHVAGAAAVAATNIIGAAQALASTVGFWVRKIAFEVAGWARVRAIAALAWALNLAEDVAGWAQRIAIAGAFWAQLIAVEVLAYARRKATDLAFRAWYLGARLAEFGASLALHLWYYSSLAGMALMNWVKKRAIDAAGWAGTIALLIAGIGVAIAQHVMANKIQFAIDAAGWLAKRGLAIAGWAAQAAIAAIGMITVEGIVVAGWFALAAGVAAILWMMRDQVVAVFNGIVDFIGNIPQFFANLVTAIGNIIANLPQIFLDVFNWIVRIIENGINAIMSLFGALNPFGDSKKNKEGGKKAGKDAKKGFLDGFGMGDVNMPQMPTGGGGGGGGVPANVAGGADALNAALEKARDRLNELRDTSSKIREQLDGAKQNLQDLANTPIKGEKAFAEQAFKNEMAQKRLRLEIMKLEDAGGSVDEITNRMSALNGEMEMLQARKIDLRMKGAGSDALAAIDSRMANIANQQSQGRGAADRISDLQHRLEALQRSADRMDLERSLKFDPLRHQIANLIDTTKELPFDKIKKGIIEQQKEVRRLTKDWKNAEDAVSSQQKIVDALEKLNKASGGGAGGGAGGMGSFNADQFAAAGAGNFAIPGGLGGNFGIEPGSLDKLVKQWEEESQNAFGDFDIFAPFKEKWDGFKSWMRENLPKWGESARGFLVKGWSQLKGLGADIADRLGLKGGGGLSKYIDAAKTMYRGLFSSWWNSTKRGASKIWNEFKKWGKLFDPAKEALGHIWNAFKTVLGAIGAFWMWIWPMLKSVVTSIWDGIYDVIKGALEFIRGIITFVLGVINGDWGQVWEGIKTMLAGIWDAIVGIVRAAAKVFLAILKWLGENAIKAIKWLVSTAWEWFLKLPGFLASLPGRLLRALGNLGSFLWDGLKSGFNLLKDGIGVIIDKVVDFFVNLPGRIKDLTVDIGNAALSIGKTIIEKIVEGITGLLSWVGDIGKQIANAAIRFINEHIIDGLNSIEIRVDKGPFHFTLGLPDIPHIPELARGGIVPAQAGGMLARLGEAGRNEAVIPLPNGFDFGRWALKIEKQVLAPSDGKGDRVINIYGNLEFPNIHDGNDAESFIRNLEALVDA